MKFIISLLKLAGNFVALFFLMGIGKLIISGWAKYIALGFLVLIGYLYVTKETFLEKQNRLATEAYNENVEELLKQCDALKKDLGAFYVYTNDTDPLWLSLVPGIPNNNTYQGMVSSVYTQESADNIRNFLDRDDLGYFIELHNSKTSFLQFQVAKSGFGQSPVKKFALYVDYEYTEEELKNIKKIYDKQQSQSKALTFNNGKREPFSKDWFKQYESQGIIIEEEELKTGELKAGLRALYQPRINRNNPNYKFYFSCYNSQISKEEFSKAIQQFNSMYLKDDCHYISNCNIRKIEYHLNKAN